jgi:hypothetical protein
MPVFKSKEGKVKVKRTEEIKKSNLLKKLQRKIYQTGMASVSS